MILPKKILALIIFLSVVTIAILTDMFFDKYDLKFQIPFKSPILIQERKTVWLSPFVKHIEAKEEKKERIFKNDIEREIYEVFGEKDYDNALKIFKCESGLKPKAVGKNNNGTFDVGIPQINTVHGIKAKWLKNQEIAIRVAKQLFDEQNGWGAWYSSYKCHGVSK